ncbi:hypothetical protein G4B88_011843 [Cannabis sativa]|uniref:CCHC-type domain-containing protein n=1 Tax=Cannabis sativa TaxID=3483 RepID=A0A7J6HDY9_CANSA|nr:hypothetical protein G4B88_011843 [Cannabis sativa]
MGRVKSTATTGFLLVLASIFLCDFMDLELVNRLAEVLVLDEGDGPVLPLNKVGIEEGKKRLDLCLVGKVIGPRPANRDGIEKAMKGFTSFWISINNVPLACMTELFAREWGERIGKLEDIKIVNGTMKVRVRINITEPLKRGLRVAVDDQGNEVSLIFQYEHLPDFCYDCGIIGHKALDCPLRDFAGDNPRFDNGRYGSWMCAPGSPIRDRPRFQNKRENSPSNRPIMTMGEASRIVSAVERSRARYSGPTAEQLAPTSVLEARERDEELLSHATAEKNSVVASENHLAMDGAVVDGQLGIDGANDKGVLKSTSLCNGKSDGGPMHDNDNVEIGVMLPDSDKGKVVLGGECSLGRDIDSSSVDVIMEDGGVISDQRKQQLIKDRKGKGVMGHSDHDEITFSHALQHTFEPLIKAQKSKTWKRLNSSYGRGSKGMYKVPAMPISPKLSHILVANATLKTSPKVGGGGKRKMEKEVERDMINGDLIHSDHRPVVASLENVVRLKHQGNQRRFRFETHWLKDDECLDIVDQTWLTPDAPLDSQDSIIDIFGRCADSEIERYFGTVFSSASPSVQQVANGITHIEGRVSSEECEMKVVGDGQSVNAFRDPWLPRPRTFRPISPAPGGTVMVSDLIGGQGSWDVGSLSRYFMQADIDIILGIPLRVTLEQWRKAQNTNCFPLYDLQQNGDGLELWSKLATNVYKVNVDVAIFEREGLYGFVMVARSDSWTLVGVQSSCRHGDLDVVTIEAMGVKDILSWIKNISNTAIHEHGLKQSFSRGLSSHSQLAVFYLSLLDDVLTNDQDCIVCCEAVLPAQGTDGTDPPPLDEESEDNSENEGGEGEGEGEGEREGEGGGDGSSWEPFLKNRSISKDVVILRHGEEVLYRNNEGGVLSPLRYGWMIFGESLSEVEFVEGAMDYVHRIPIIEEEDGIFQRYFELTEEISNYRSFLKGLHLRLSAITGH